MKINHRIYFVYIVLLGASVAGCQVQRMQQQADASIGTPAHFTGAEAGADSSMASMPWRQFFTDTTLVHLIDTALHNNPDLQIALQRVEAARSNILLSRGALLPAVNAVASAAVDNYGEYTMNGVGNDDTNLSPNVSGKRKIPDPTPDYFLGLRSSWEMDIWGKLKNKKKAALARYLASAKGRQFIVTELVAEVAALYYQLVALDRELEIVEKNIALQADALEIVKVQKLGGRATELAVQQFAAQLLRTKAIAFDKKQQMAVLENGLNNLLGRFAVNIPRNKDFYRQLSPDSLHLGIPAAMLQRRPDIQQAELELLASKADVSAAKAAFFPSLVLTPYIGFNAFRVPVLFDAGSLAYGVLGSLSAPLLNRRELKANFAVANARQQEAFFTYRKTVVQAYNEVITQLQQIRNANEIYQLKLQELEQLNSGVATARDLYMGGYANYLEVITAQKNLLEASLESIEAGKQQTVAAVNLYKALGGGWN